MTLRYKIVKQASPGIKGGGEYSYYLRATDRKKITTDELAKNLARQTSLSEVDVKYVLSGLSLIIPELLLDNKSVELGELGIFSVSFKSNPAPTAEEATWRNIRDLKVNFRIGKAIQQHVKKASFKQSEK